MTHKILAIDDHPQTLDIIIIILQQHGYQAMGSNSPVEALSIAEAEHPDLILLDMNMPEMNGKEVCRRLRAHPQLQDTPIIMFSAEAAEKQASFEIGADDFLVKPTDPDLLVDRIEALLEKTARARAREEVESKKPPPRGAEREDAEILVDAETRPQSGLLIAVLGVRGGSGATTLATNLAFGSAEVGYPTTLVDLDVRQGHVGPFLKAKPDNGINTLASLQEDQLRERLPALLVDHGKNLDLLLTRPNPDGRFATPTPQQTAIIVNALTRSRECVIVDLGHEINSITRAVLDGADHVIVCLRPERVALAAARVMLGQLKDMLYEHTTLRTMVIGIVGGMSLPRNAIERFLGYPLLATIPARPSEVMQALNKGVPYLQLYPDSPISKFYRLLAKRLVVS